MRILLTTQGYPPTISGVTLLVQRLAHALTKKGYDVIVLAGSDRLSPYEQDDAGVRIIRLQSHPNPYWPANPVPALSRKSLVELIGKLQPDIIHAHDALPFCLPLTRDRAELGLPLVATCHYIPSFVAAYVAHERVSAQAVDFLTRRFSITLYNRVDVAVFPTMMQRDRFLEWGLAVPTRVISNGVDLQRYTPEPLARDACWAAQLPKAPRVLAVGRLAIDKHLDVLIRAVAALETVRRAAMPHQALQPVHLFLAGDGPYRPELEKCARKAGVEDLVHFFGFVPEEDLPGLYRHCDVFAISSIFEVQSIPALQAAACGLPIVASSAGSLPEICHDGKNGLLVYSDDPQEYARAIQKVLAPDVKARMSQASRKIASEHDEQRTFDAYEALYQLAVSSLSQEAAKDVRGKPHGFARNHQHQADKYDVIARRAFRQR